MSASPGDSDHCPIYVAIMRQNYLNDHQINKWNFKKADWTTYTNDEIWTNLPDVATVENKLLIVDLYNRFYQAAQNSIPICRSTKYVPKPWWTDALKNSKAQRERLYKVYRRNKTILNLIKWKQAHAQHKHKHNVKESKKECWRKFVAELNKRTPMAKVYEIMRKIKGSSQRKINILCEDGLLLINT